MADCLAGGMEELLVLVFGLEMGVILEGNIPEQCHLVSALELQSMIIRLRPRYYMS